MTLTSQATSWPGTRSWDAADFKLPMTLKTTPIFDGEYQKIKKVTFSFPNFVSACKKISYSNDSFFDIHPISESCDQSATSIFGKRLTQYFFINFNFHEFVLTCKKTANYTILL